MKWIKASDLEAWSKRLSARADFPGLVGDLIRASVPNFKAFRFPTGDKGQVRGFDGRLSTTEEATFVPAGDSIWEFGITAEAASKFGEDIEKRSGQVPLEERRKTAFVFVTPHTWDTPKKKIEDALKPYAKYEWREIQYIDGSQLETWLDAHPAVAATHARLTLQITPQSGARSCEEFWEAYATRFSSRLPEDVLLCGREPHAAQVLEHLQGADGVLTLTADSPDEVIAFAVAAIRKAPTEQRLFLEARTLIVESEGAALFLRTVKDTSFLVRAQATGNEGMLAQSGPTLVGQGRDQGRRGDEFLGYPSYYEMGKALASMEGVDEEAGIALARKCGRSVTILARTIPSGARVEPEWLAHGRTLVPSMLAGGWNAQSEEDQRVLALLADHGDYDRLERELRPLTRLQDAPIDLVGNVWQMRAPVDAFVNLARLLAKSDLERLEKAVSEVFGRIVVPPSPDEPLIPRRKDDDFSTWLRDGLATTLLQLATLADQAEFSVAGVYPQQFVDGLIKSLPGLASDERLIISIRNELPLLMEAAPDPLFSALEQLLGGDGSAAAELLIEREGFLSPSSHLTNVLWAVETMAWDPNYLERTTLLLGRLAELDPGGRLSNRPINSLRAIFLPWLPSTNAGLRQRQDALEALIRAHPAVGWELMLQMLPESHSTTSLTSKPRFREAGASAKEELTWGIVWEMQSFATEQAFTLAGDNVERWLALIDAFPSLRPENRKDFYSLIERRLGATEGDDRKALWSRLRDQVNRHRSFADAAWALPEEELSPLQYLVERFEPRNALDRFGWLFDDWFPDLPTSRRTDEAALREEREKAVRSLLEDGYETLLQAVKSAKLPHTLAEALLKVSNDTDLFQKMLEDLIGDDTAASFIATISASSLGSADGWRDRISSLWSSGRWTAAQFVPVVLAWPDDSSTWQYLDATSPDLATEYWLRKNPYRADISAEELTYSVERYITVGRPSAALRTLHRRAGEVEADTLLKILDELPAELAQDKPKDQLLGYELEKLFKHLADREDAPVGEVARREYGYIALFEHSDVTLNLHRLMAQDPSFFYSVIADVFRGEHEEKTDEPSPEQVSRARTGFTLLRNFKIVPGAGESDAATKLIDWVEGVRKFAAEGGRQKITDQYIGHVLAHAPVDEQSGQWPPPEVEEALDHFRSKEIENGVAVEVYNSRGVVSKAIFEGGGQERAIAVKYEKWAQQTDSLRSKAVLNEIARHYHRYAEEEDLRAEQEKMARD